MIIVYLLADYAGYNSYYHEVIVGIVVRTVIFLKKGGENIDF